jgi:hypothetical protein
MDRDAQYAENKRLVEERKKRERENFLNSSKERLRKITDKKIETTMIGAISYLEQEFQELAKSLTDNQAVELYECFERIRNKILDNGNKQKRNFHEELNQYTVEWHRFSTTFNVRIGE